MYARITKFKMKPDSIAAAGAMTEKLKHEIMALPGMIQFVQVINGNGGGYIIGIVTDKATSEGNADKIKAIWANFSDVLESPPEMEGFDVMNNWRA